VQVLPEGHPPPQLLGAIYPHSGVGVGHSTSQQHAVVEPPHPDGGGPLLKSKNLQLLLTGTTPEPHASGQLHEPLQFCKVTQPPPQYFV